MRYSKTKGYKFKLEEDEKTYVEIDANCYNDYISLDEGVLIIRHGYAWDGSSIPLKRFVPRWVYDFDKYCKIASLVHDSLCQLMREGLLPKSYKKYIDGLYREMCIDGRMKIWEKETKKKTIRKRKREEKRAKKWADRRYRWLRKFGDAYIEKEKHPRNEIFEI